MAFVVTEIDTINSSTATQGSWVSASFNVSAGDLIVIAEAHPSGADPSTVVDSNGNSYTKETSAARSTVIDGSLWAFYYTGAATGITITVTYAASVSCRLGKVLRVTGEDSSFLDTVTAGGSGGNAVHSASGLGPAGGPMPAGTMTPTNADLIIAMIGWGNSTAPSAGPSGYTKIGSDLLNATRARSLSAYYKVQGATGAENPSWNLANNIEWAAMQMGIKASLAGPQKLRAERDASNSGGYTTDTGASTNLVSRINEAIIDDSTYVQSPGLTPGGAHKTWRWKINAGNPPGAGSLILKTRYREDVAGADTVNAKSRLYQGGGNTEGAGTLIKERTYSGIGAVAVEDDYTLTGPEAASITDFGDLWREFEVWAT